MLISEIFHLFVQLTILLYRIFDIFLQEFLTTMISWRGSFAYLLEQIIETNLFTFTKHVEIIINSFLLFCRLRFKMQ